MKTIDRCSSIYSHVFVSWYILYRKNHIFLSKKNFPVKVNTRTRTIDNHRIPLSLIDFSTTARRHVSTRVNFSSSSTKRVLLKVYDDKVRPLYSSDTKLLLFYHVACRSIAFETNRKSYYRDKLYVINCKNAIFGRRGYAKVFDFFRLHVEK